MLKFHLLQWIQPAPRKFQDKNGPVHLKPVLRKPVGRMDIFGGILHFKTRGSLGIAWKRLGIPRTEKWPKTGHADGWGYCDWV